MMQARERDDASAGRGAVLPARGVVLPDLVASLRPEQWVKNGFVFTALVFSLHLTDAAAVARTLATFVVFCLASSAA